jgi:hypothetical protein
MYNFIHMKYTNTIFKHKIIKEDEKNYMPPERIELSTPGLQDQCSNH